MQPVIVSTFRHCLEQGYEICVHCPACGRYAPVDLAAIVQAGRGSETFVRRRWRCAGCGGEGGMTLCPPAFVPHERVAPIGGSAASISSPP